MAATRRKHLPAHPVRRSSPARTDLKTQFLRAATSPTAKTTYAVVGTVGLAALAIAILGPRRFQREILKPVQGKVSDQAAQLWNDSKSVRDQIGKLFERASNAASREKLAHNLQSWVGHFKAT